MEGHALSGRLDINLAVAPPPPYARDAASVLAAAISRAEPVVVVLGERASTIRVLDQFERLMSNQNARLVRIQGAEGAILTLPHIIEELGAGASDGIIRDDDELIVRVLTKGRHDQSTILILERAERLPPRTLAFLQVVSTLFGSRRPGLQIVLAGRPPLMDLIATDELTGLRDRVESVIETAGLQTGSPGYQSREPAAALSRPSRFPYKTVFCLGVLTAGIAVVVPISSGWRWQFADEPASSPEAGALMQPKQSEPKPHSDSAPASPARNWPPGDVVVAPPALPPAPPAPSRVVTSPPPGFLPSPPPGVLTIPAPSAAQPVPDRLPTVPAQPGSSASVPSEEQLARLRTEFQRFLDSSNRSNRTITDAARAELFADFLRWRYGHTGKAKADR